MNKFNFSNNLVNSASVVIAVSFMIVAFLAIAFFWPGIQELIFLQKNIAEKKSELQGKEEYFSKLYQIKSQLAERSEDFSKIESSLPDDPSLPSVFNYLQIVSSESGLILEKISSFSVSSSNNLPGLKEAVFNINVIGSYSSFKNFLLVLEKSARLIEVENISFSLSKEDEIFAFDLKIKTHSYDKAEASLPVPEATGEEDLSSF